VRFLDAVVVDAIFSFSREFYQEFISELLAAAAALTSIMMFPRNQIVTIWVKLEPRLGFFAAATIDAISREKSGESVFISVN
jgi:hypothetical protein